MNVKQILSHVRSLKPHTWVKLTFLDIHINIKWIPSHVRSLGPQTWVKVNTI